jgi:hypothetical protein
MPVAEQRAGRDDPVVTPDEDRWRRLVATRANERLPVGSLAPAAASGLQDSAPRAAQLSLHARVREVAPSAWEHDDLVQIWFRWADYVVPAADRALFTLGTLPRDDGLVGELEHVTDTVLGALESEGGDSRAARRRLHDVPFRSACATGRLIIRWDARTIEMLPAEVPDVGVEEARVALARRFMHCYGPVGPRHLARWAGVAEADAIMTWEALGDDVTLVASDGVRRCLLTADVDAVGIRPEGVRLLPQGDPALYARVPSKDHRPRPAVAPSAGVTQRLVNSLTGRVVVDGDIVGSWGRVRGDVSVHPWVGLGDRRVEVEEAAAGVATAVGHDPRVRWLV